MTCRYVTVYSGVIDTSSRAWRWSFTWYTQVHCITQAFWYKTPCWLLSIMLCVLALSLAMLGRVADKIIYDRVLTTYRTCRVQTHEVNGSFSCKHLWEHAAAGFLPGQELHQFFPYILLGMKLSFCHREHPPGCPFVVSIYFTQNCWETVCKLSYCCLTVYVHQFLSLVTVWQGFIVNI